MVQVERDRGRHGKRWCANLSDKVRTSTEFPNCYLRSIIEGRIDAYQFLLADENPLPQTTILKIGAHGFVCGNLTIEPQSWLYP